MIVSDLAMNLLESVANFAANAVIPLHDSALDDTYRRVQSLNVHRLPAIKLPTYLSNRVSGASRWI